MRVTQCLSAKSRNRQLSQLSGEKNYNNNNKSSGIQVPNKKKIPRTRNRAGALLLRQTPKDVAVLLLWKHAVDPKSFSFLTPCTPQVLASVRIRRFRFLYLAHGDGRTDKCYV